MTKYNKYPPPPYESIYETSFVLNTPPPASNDVILSSADVAARSGRLSSALPVGAATGSPSNDYILLKIHRLATEIRTIFFQTNDALAYICGSLERVERTVANHASAFQSISSTVAAIDSRSDVLEYEYLKIDGFFS